MINIYNKIKQMGYCCCTANDECLHAYVNGNIVRIAKSNNTIYVNDVAMSESGFYHWLNKNKSMPENEITNTLAINPDELKTMNSEMVYCVNTETNQMMGKGMVFTDGVKYLYIKIAIATSRYIVKHLNDYLATWIAFRDKDEAETYIKRQHAVLSLD